MSKKMFLCQYSSMNIKTDTTNVGPFSGNVNLIID